MPASTAAASKSGLYADPREDWLALRKEEIIDPSRPIVDPHHHLWDRGGLRYLIEDMAADIASGHNIIATVYVEARSMYRAQGPEAFRPVGEVEFANGAAAMSASGGYGQARICLDHCGGLVGIGVYANRREELFPVWKASIKELAKCPNVVVKLGGLAMRLLGYDFHERPKPPSSEQAAAAWKPYIETCIEVFGPERSMFESNFPPDKGQCSYQVIFNAFKRIAAPYSEAEKTTLFSETAAGFYQLKLG